MRIGWLRIDPQGKAIESINIQTTLPVGAIRLALGAPDTNGVTGYDPYLFQSSFYLDDGFAIYNVFTCPIIQRAYWNARVRISYIAPMTKWSAEGTPSTPFTCSSIGSATLSTTVCALAPG